MNERREVRFADWACLRFHLAWAYQGRVWPPARVGSYSNMRTSCWLILRGSVSLITDGKKTVARAGQWVFVASPTRHQTFSLDAEILSIHFDLTWPGGEQTIPRPQNLVLEAKQFPALESTAMPLIRAVARDFPGAHAFLMNEPCALAQYLRVQNLLPAWLVAYLSALESLEIVPKRSEVEDARILRVLSILDQHPHTQAFSASRLATQSGLSRSRLDALFVSAMGVTPRSYLERRRIEEASKLLLHTTSSVKEIALNLGFRHPSHFSLWFRRHRQMSPQAFRESREPAPAPKTTSQS